jgi:ketol-acid reductoisomerase
LKELRESELWQAGKTVRSLRPENQKEVKPVSRKDSKTAELLKKMVENPESID